MMEYFICETTRYTSNKSEVCFGQAKFRNKEGYNSPIVMTPELDSLDN